MNHHARALAMPRVIARHLLYLLLAAQARMLHQGAPEHLLGEECFNNYSMRRRSKARPADCELQTCSSVLDCVVVSA